MKKFGAFLVFLLAFAVIIAMAGFFAGHWITSSDENLRYVYIGDIDVSGLTRDETEQLLTSRGWKAREENVLTVTSTRCVPALLHRWKTPWRELMPWGITATWSAISSRP